MAMDGLALRAVVFELDALRGGKIDKVQQPEKDVLLFTLRCERKNYRLLVNTHAENGRMQLTSQSYDNPATAPAFCMLLRRHLLGGRIERIEQSGADRACTFFILSRNELMDDVNLRLVVELMGKHANVILVDGEGKILDCLRHVSPSETSTRVLLPGFLYHPAPASEKYDPLAAEPEALQAVYASPMPARTLTDTFEGVSRATATALLSTCAEPTALAELLANFSQNLFAPTVVYDAFAEPLSVLPFAPREIGCTQTGFSGMSEALDCYFAERDTFVRIRRHGTSLRRAVEHALGRAQNKQRSFLDALESDEKLEALRLNGELILANLHAIRPGATQLSAYDYYVDPPVPCTVTLDPAVNAQENAKRFFKQYRKGKLSREYARSQLATVTDEIAYLEGQLENIDRCETLSELEEVREELIAQRFLKPDAKKRPKQFSIASKPLAFRSSEGYEIFVGKNNRQNDALTMKTALPDNLFLHAKNMPGSHVVVICDGIPPEQTLLEAATLAALFSSGKSAPTVPVDYTLRRNVKKPSGARPGMVVYSTNKTLFVAPNAALAKRLQGAKT